MTESPRRPPLKKAAAPSTPRRSKRDRYTLVACNECKTRKVKCSGHSCCRRCAKHGARCVYDRVPPAEREPGVLCSNGEGVQLELERMQASIHALLYSIKSTGLPNTGFQPALQFSDSTAAPSPSTDCNISRTGSDGGSNAAAEELGALVNLEDTMYRLSGLHDAMQSLCPRVPVADGQSSLTTRPNFQHSLWPLSKDEAFEILNSFREEVDTLYPFINLAELTRLLDDCLSHPQERRDMKTAGWSDTDDSRNVDLLKLVIACSLAARGKDENNLGYELMTTVEEKSVRKMNGHDIDMKDLAIATMLSVYYYQNDEITLAWRKIGGAARMCLELGMHKIDDAPKDEIASKQAPWVSKMFWSIYVLDRRYSFMTNLPFTFRDEDIDPQLPLPDNSAPFLLPMVSYGRLGAKVLPALPGLKSACDDLDSDICMYLGSEIDCWIQSTTLTAPFSKHAPVRCFSSIEPQNTYNSLATFCRIRGNQMHLSLYKHALHSPGRIARNQHFAQLAVHCATDNIRILQKLDPKPLLASPPVHNSPFSPHSHLSATPSPTSITKEGNNHPGRQVQRNFFLTSSLVVLYLAIRNAPQQYSAICMHEYFAALNLLRSSATAPTSSRRLRETVKMLEDATCSLARGPMLAFAQSMSSPPPIGLGDGSPSALLFDESVPVESLDERRGEADFWEERQCLPWGDAGVGSGETDGLQDLRTYGGEGWWQPRSGSDLYAAASPPSGVYLGGCWSEGSVL